MCTERLLGKKKRKKKKTRENIWKKKREEHTSLCIVSSMPYITSQNNKLYRMEVQNIHAMYDYDA